MNWLALIPAFLAFLCASLIGLRGLWGWIVLKDALRDDDRRPARADECPQQEKAA